MNIPSIIILWHIFDSPSHKGGEAFDVLPKGLLPPGINTGTRAGIEAFEDWLNQYYSIYIWLMVHAKRGRFLIEENLVRSRVHYHIDLRDKWQTLIPGTETNNLPNHIFQDVTEFYNFSRLLIEKTIKTMYKLINDKRKNTYVWIPYVFDNHLIKLSKLSRKTTDKGRKLLLANFSEEILNPLPGLYPEKKNYLALLAGALLVFVIGFVFFPDISKSYKKFLNSK